MEIIYKSLSELKPYENNPRKNDDAVQYVANSIKQFGFRVPIIIKPDGEIVAGHTRYKACLQLGIEKVPCIIADDLTEEQIKAFRIADNKTSEKSVWDIDKIKLELEDINMDMTDFGFGEFELSMIVDDMNPEPYDDDVIEKYSEDSDDYLAVKRVIITYTKEEEEWLKKLLKVEELKVLYHAKDLKNEDNTN